MQMSLCAKTETSSAPPAICFVCLCSYTKLTDRIVYAVSDEERRAPLHARRASGDGLVDVQGQSDHHLDHHRHEQVLVDSRPVVAQTPANHIFNFIISKIADF